MQRNIMFMSHKAKAIMRKLLMTSFALITVYSFAELSRDPSTARYYTSPATPEINQVEYHVLVWQCKDIQSQCARQQAALNNQFAGQGNGSYRQAYGPLYVRNTITSYLQRVATPTSMRLLEDLNKNNFAL